MAASKRARLERARARHGSSSHLRPTSSRKSAEKKACDALSPTWWRRPPAGARADMVGSRPREMAERTSAASSAWSKAVEARSSRSRAARCEAAALGQARCSSERVSRRR
jgi:hypothetical protein